MSPAQADGLRRILLSHAGRYPQMEPQDGVKLIYQNEFGGGHLITGPDQALAALAKERSVTPFDPAAPLSEDLGDGMVRVNLAALDGENYPLEQLNRDFVRSAALRQGNMGRFREKLAILEALAETGALSFSAQALADYLADYCAAGCPAVSHSDTYRAAYRPAYRVLLRSVSLPLLAAEANALRQRRVLVALDGRCAAGKTTLAAQLRQRYGWSVVHMDHFFPRPEQRTVERCAQPGGNIDHERFLAELLLPLREGRTPLYRPFDCHSGRLLDPIPFVPGPVVLAEGSYACHPALREHFDLRAFLDIGPALQMDRITAREGEAYARVFREKWIPLEEAYFSSCQVEKCCGYHLEAWS